jgi:hypothetical protein
VSFTWKVIGLLVIAALSVGAGNQLERNPELKAAVKQKAGVLIENEALKRKLRVRTAERDKARRNVRRQYVGKVRVRRELTRAMQSYPSMPRIIEVAATAYGQSATTLLRKAECESGLWPFARNPSGASGLFQFLPSTWDSTPFRRHSIWDPWAQALAASWMHSHLRGGEWVCR